MRQLFLMRHAKSSWDNPGLRDFDRPLNKQGRKAAVKMGRFMKDEELVPEIVCSSPAARTRETVEHWQSAAGYQPELLYVDGLYGAGLGQLFRVIRQTDEVHRRLMLVGHNPGLHELAIALIETTGDKNTTLFQKFPTATLAVFDLPLNRWSDIAPGNGRLRSFIRPKAL